MGLGGAASWDRDRNEEGWSEELRILVNVRTFSSHVKQKANSLKVVSKETVLNDSLVQTKIRSPQEVTSDDSVAAILWPGKFLFSSLLTLTTFA